jgi:hypothetical protein
MTDPTPTERHLRDLANAVYARLRTLERDGGNATSRRTEGSGLFAKWVG